MFASTHRHCNKCWVDWTVVPDGMNCWSCGMPGATGPIARLATRPATVYTPAPKEPR